MRASIFTLGCRLNQAESSLLHARLDAAGYTLVPHGEPADLGIVNTCTVTAEADAKSRKTIRAFIRQNPAAFVAVIGCMSQLHAQQVARIPGVDLVMGNANKLDLLQHVRPHKNPVPAVFCNGLPTADFTIDAVAATGPTTRANLKIQEGCDCMCTYCIVPFARGKPRSRHMLDLLEEATALAARGVKEIVLTGINVGAYACRGATIVDVVDALDSVNGLARIRISSIELSTIPRGLLDRMNDPRHALVPFLHVPLQSGCDKTLRAMGRTYTALDFAAFLDAARAAVGQLCIGADVIVGFPGETDADFDASCRFVLESPIDYTHVFKFSPRPGTPAAQMPGRVDPRELSSRGTRMREIGALKRVAFHLRHEGHRVDVLFEQQSAGKWTGYTPNYIRVAVASPRNLENQIAPVVLRKTCGATMTGVLDP
jgi:threonylcarbamoyladenosine tRNA methylthiotransferase MtaB